MSEESSSTMKANVWGEETNGILSWWPSWLKRVTEYDISSQQELAECRLTKSISRLLLRLLGSQRKCNTILVPPDAQYAPGSSSAQ